MGHRMNPRQEIIDTLTDRRRGWRDLWHVRTDEPRRLELTRHLPPDGAGDGGVRSEHLVVILDAAGRVETWSTWVHVRISIDDDVGCRSRLRRWMESA